MKAGVHDVGVKTHVSRPPHAMGDRQLQKVLFVDDDEDIRTIAHFSLSTVGGWQVTLAASGPRAIEQAMQDPPDLIILDVMMPGMDGYSTLERLRNDERTASIPVIFLTATVRNGELERYRAAGAGLIAKPFDPIRLPDQVRLILSPMAASEPVAGAGR
jgi:CheY-like chemotaxis protein